MPLPRWRPKFQDKSSGASSAWTPLVNDAWEFCRMARPLRGVRTGGRPGAPGPGDDPGDGPRPQPDRAPRSAPSQPAPACVFSPSAVQAPGARRRRLPWFPGVTWGALAPPPALRGGAGAGAGRPRKGRGAAAVGAGGAGDDSSSPEAVLVQPPQPHGAAARREPRAGPAGPPGPSAPRSQRVAQPASSPLARRPRGPRPVRGGGEGGAPAPVGRGGRMSIEIPAGLTELLQGFTVEVLRHQPADLLEFALQHFTRLQEENERKGAARFGHEGRTWGDAGAAGGGGTPSRGVNFAEEPMHSGSENGEEEEAADAGAFNGKEPTPARPLPPPPLPLGSSIPQLGSATSPCLPHLPYLPFAPTPSASISVSPARPPSYSALSLCPPPRPLLWRWGAQR